MTRGKKLIRKPVNAPRVSPPTKEPKRPRPNNLDSFLSLAGDSEDEAEPISQPTSSESAPGRESTPVESHVEASTRVNLEEVIPTGGQSNDETGSSASDATVPTGPSVITVSTEQAGPRFEVPRDEQKQPARPELRPLDTIDGHNRSAGSPQGHQRMIPPRPWVLRYDLKLRPSVLSSETSIIDELRKMFTFVRSVDPSFILYRWYDDAANAPNISDPRHLPRNLRSARAYFPRLAARINGTDIHTAMRIGLSISPEEFRNKTASWMKANNAGCWPCKLQCAQSVCVGWLLYSVRDLDLQALTTAIYARTKIRVGLRWRPIRTGAAPSSSNATATRAVHIEVAAADETAATSSLRALYGTTSMDPFPNGVRLRLVPEVGPHMSSVLRAKVDRLRLRQAHFLTHAIRIVNWEIAALDFQDSKAGSSLRSLLMSCLSKDQPNLHLFHSVDRTWNGNGHVFTIVPLLEGEARAVITGLLPFLRATFPDIQDDLMKYFTPEAVQRAELVHWDVTLHSLVTSDDELIQDLLDEPDVFQLHHSASILLPTDLGLTPQAAAVTTTLLAGESDSVSTFRTGWTHKGSSDVTLTRMEGDESSQPSRQASTVSSLTVEERLFNLEKKMDSLLDKMLAHSSQANFHTAPHERQQVGSLRAEAAQVDTDQSVDRDP